MARDAELDRLKAAQDLAFQRKQDAWQAQDRAWKQKETAKAALDIAFQDKQRAYAEQDNSWQALQRVRASNGPRIDQLNSQQESAFQNMKRAFEQASFAYDRGDKAEAKRLSDEGKRYKAESQGYVVERRQLVAEIRAASDAHKATKPAFQQAKDRFNQAKREHDQAKEVLERAKEEFKKAKAAFEDAKEAFHKRLETVRSQSKRRKDDKRALAEKAGIPYQYRDNVWVSKDSDGNVNIYFGGVGKPDGPGHGHYVMDSSGKVTYKRDPFDPHGAQNFEDVDDPSLLFIRSARSSYEPLGNNEHGGVFYRRDDAGGTVLHITQYFADKYRVSWDATPGGNKNVHWTNESLHKGHPDRHTPPSDAIL